MVFAVFVFRELGFKFAYPFAVLVCLHFSARRVNYIFNIHVFAFDFKVYLDPIFAHAFYILSGKLPQLKKNSV